MGRSDASLLLKLFGIVVYNIFVWKNIKIIIFYIFLIYNITYKNHKKSLKTKITKPSNTKNFRISWPSEVYNTSISKITFGILSWLFTQTVMTFD